MQLKDILELAAVLLGLQTVLDSGAFEDGLDKNEIKKKISENKDLQLLIRCANLVYKEIACDYLQLKAVDTLVSNGNINYTSLTKHPLEILSVTDEKGADVGFNCLAGCLQTVSGKVSVCYSYIPLSAEFNDELDFFGSKITDRILAYGTASEYCLINGQGQDAVVWDKRYKDALVIACRKRTEIKMPKRRWLA